MRANTLSIAVVAFLVVGTVGWVAGMPRPAQMVSEPGWSGDISAETGDGTSPEGAGVEGGQATIAPAAAEVRALDAAVSPTQVPTATLPLVDPAWIAGLTATTGIPPRALQAYAGAALAEEAERPGCGIGWNTLAAIGHIETGHGTHDGAVITDSGAVEGQLLGPVLDGSGVGAIRDTDDGRLDGDLDWDRAVGPMQFIPQTWADHGVDASGDGVADPNQIDDAAKSAADYLCIAGGDLATSDGWVAAVLAYNRDESYVERVREQANEYAAAAL